MRVIVAHENLDFDALGSLLLARKLYPDALAVWVGGLEGRLREVFGLHEDVLGLQHASSVQLSQVTEVVVVDTARAERLGSLGTLVGKVPFVVYDHHPPVPGDIPSVGGAVGTTGSTAALLLPLLQAQGLRLSATEASLVYAGIWEDTGGFSYPSTSKADLDAASTLVDWGAQPKQVGEWVRERYGPEARQLLQNLMNSSQLEVCNGFKLLVVQARDEGYIPALAPLAHTLLDLYDAEGILMALELADDRLLIARSLRRLDVAAWLAEVGGGGHPNAAFARIEGSLEQAKTTLLQRLAQHLPSGLSVAERMSQPVESLPEDLSVAQALELLKQRGFGGMPVVNNRIAGQAEVFGIARRRDLEKAVHHGLGASPVRGFLARAIVLPPQTPLFEAEQALKAGAGRVLVGVPQGSGYRLLGIFTRTDLYRSLKPASDWLEQLMQRFPQGVRQVLQALVQLYPKGGVYVVGGAVRDGVLGSMGPDLDLAIEPPVRLRELLEALVQRFGGSYNLHVAFGTARLRLGFGLELDVAEAREEFYAHPGALPQVRAAGIARDLERRDFTLNAMALRLAPRPELLDPFGGLQDLKARLLRPLHPLSFVEDPSRILRGVRLAARLGLALAPEAVAQIPAALSPNILEKTSHSRLKDELLLCLQEAASSKALAQLSRLGVLQAMFGFEASPVLLAQLEQAEGPHRFETQLYLLLWHHPNPQRFLQRFVLPKRYHDGLAWLKKPPQHPEHLHRLVGLPEAFALLYPERSVWLYSPKRVLMGRDLLAMGLEAGPRMGQILKAVSEARLRGEVLDYEAEVALARKLIADELWTTEPAG